MKMKKVLALMMALAVVGTVGAPAITADAEGLSQAATPDAVNYGTVSAEDIELLKGLFDVNYYIEQNPDIVALCGTDYDKLFEHFVKRGVFEGRTCNANFDPSAYASAYSELKGAFGLDILKYYEHYAKIGIKENRTLTTLKACAEKGITVTTLTKDAVAITPQVFYLADKLKTKDFSTVANAVNRAAATQQTTVVETDNGTLVMTPRKDLNTLKNYKTVGSFKVGDEEITYYIFANNTGTGVYTTPEITSESVAVYITTDAELTTEDYIGKWSVLSKEYSDEMVDNALNAINEDNNALAYSKSESYRSNYGLTWANPLNGNKKYHVAATHKSEGGNFISIRTLDMSNNLGNESKQKKTSGVSSSFSYDKDFDTIMLYIDGIYKDDGSVEYIPYEYGTDEYRQRITEEHVNSQAGWFDIDSSGNTSSTYNICIGSEEIDESKTDLTIGVYNKDSGFYEYNTLHIVDIDEGKVVNGQNLPEGVDGNTAHGGAQSNGTAEQQNSDDE